MIVPAILYKLKTGCQWRQLPMKSLFGNRKYKWISVYHHFRQWAKAELWQILWTKLLQKHKAVLDMSSVQLDGSHSPVKRGGTKVAYQGRKKSKTTNMLILTDSQGIPVSCSRAISGNHNDAHPLNTYFEYHIIFTKRQFVSCCGDKFEQKFNKLCSKELALNHLENTSRQKKTV